MFIMISLAAFHITQLLTQKKNRDTYFKGNFIYFVAQIMICSKNMIYLIYLSLLKKTGELTNWNCT